MKTKLKEIEGLIDTLRIDSALKNSDVDLDKRLYDIGQSIFKAMDKLEEYSQLQTSNEEIKEKDFTDNGFSKSDDIYFLRISDLIWCEIDEHGFATLVAKKEFANKQNPYHKVVIPRPIRIKIDLYNLLFTLGMRDNIPTPKKEGVNNKTLQYLMNEISAWSDATFGEGQRNLAIAHHLLKEVKELITELDYQNQPSDHVKGDGEKSRDFNQLYLEFADCFMLLLDSAHHSGLTADNLCYYTKSKLEINKKREWGKPDKHGVVEHIKEENKYCICKNPKIQISRDTKKEYCFYCGKKIK